jgi:hypothetical protein
MSFDAMAWAAKQSPKNPTAKLCLMMMASMADAETGQCWPSHQYLADQCMCSRRTIVSTLQYLEQDGYITVKRRFKDNVKTSNLYLVNSNVQNLHKGCENIAQGGSENIAHRNSHSSKQSIKPLVKLAFDRWWESYPKKKAKQDALKAFTAIVQNKSAEKIESFADHIIADTKNRAANEESWQREGGRYIPNGSTYIRGQRYKDAITRATPKVAALPTDMDALGKFAVEHNLHAPGQAPQTIRNAYEYRSWIQERLQANTNV